jgi:hypothetical protein
MRGENWIIAIVWYASLILVPYWVLKMSKKNKGDSIFDTIAKLDLVEAVILGGITALILFFITVVLNMLCCP